MTTTSVPRSAGEPPIVACIVVPHGCDRAPALAAALGRHQPGWEVVAIWCGDPQLRPSATGLRWGGGADDLAAADAERELVGSPEPHVALARGARAVRVLLGRGHPHVVVLVAGAVAVVGSIDALVTGTAGAITTVPLVLGELADDGLSPTPADLADAGASSVDVVVAHAGAERALDWITVQLASDPELAAGAVLDRAVELFGGRRLADERIGASAWRWPRDVAPVLLDLPGFDPRRPWLLAPEMDGVARIAVVGRAEVSGPIAAGSDQLDGRASAAHAAGRDGGRPDRPRRGVAPHGRTTWCRRRGAIPCGSGDGSRLGSGPCSTARAPISPRRSPLRLGPVATHRRSGCGSGARGWTTRRCPPSWTWSRCPPPSRTSA